jgi:hypothetical protein
MLLHRREIFQTPGKVDAGGDPGVATDRAGGVQSILITGSTGRENGLEEKEKEIGRQMEGLVCILLEAVAEHQMPKEAIEKGQALGQITLRGKGLVISPNNNSH